MILLAMTGKAHWRKSFGPVKSTDLAIQKGTKVVFFETGK
jgi:hypothetical protein